MGKGGVWMKKIPKLVVLILIGMAFLAACAEEQARLIFPAVGDQRNIIVSGTKSSTEETFFWVDMTQLSQEELDALASGGIEVLSEDGLPLFEGDFNGTAAGQITDWPINIPIHDQPETILKVIFSYEPAPTTKEETDCYLKSIGYSELESTTEPKIEPTIEPTAEPSSEPITKPTIEPISESSSEPTTGPKAMPTYEPIAEPTTETTVLLTTEPTVSPSIETTVEPTTEPTTEPTINPSIEPTSAPMRTKPPKSTATPKPTKKPKPTATPKPTKTPKPTVTPKPTKTPKPTATPKPTKEPTPIPKPTKKPTPKPTMIPKPTKNPTPKPTPVPEVRKPRVFPTHRAPFWPHWTATPAAASIFVRTLRNNVNLRRIPEGSSLMLLPIGTLLQVSGTVWDKGVLWYHVLYNEKDGYVRGDMAEQLTVRELQTYLEELADTAAQAEWETQADTERAALAEEARLKALKAVEKSDDIPSVSSVANWLLRKLRPSYTSRASTPAEVQYTYTLLTDGSIRITGYNSVASSVILDRVGTNLTIAAELNGHLVREIGPEAFAFCNELESVRIPSGITRIGAGAFRGCSSLREIYLPEGLMEIDAYAFQDCAIESIVLPEGLRMIGNEAFGLCAKLKHIDLPDSLESVGVNPFYYCSALEEIRVTPDQPSFAILNGILCSKKDRRIICLPAGKQTERLTIPEGIRLIGNEAFAGCKMLRDISLPGSLTAVGDGAFTWCSSMIAVKLPAGVDSIGDSAFLGCLSLEDCTILGNRTSIGENAFSGCLRLKMTVPRGSRAAEYCRVNGIEYNYPDAYDWLLN